MEQKYALSRNWTCDMIKKYSKETGLSKTQVYKWLWDTNHSTSSYVESLLEKVEKKQVF